MVGLLLGMKVEKKTDLFFIIILVFWGFFATDKISLKITTALL